LTIALKNTIILLLLIAALATCSCNNYKRLKTEEDMRSNLSRDKLYSIQIGTYYSLESATKRLKVLSQVFPQYKEDIHIVTIDSTDPNQQKTAFKLRSGVFIKEQKAKEYFKEFQESTGLINSKLIALD